MKKIKKVNDLFELLESERPRSRRPEPQGRRAERMISESKGFSLIELLVVVTILAILAAVGMAVFRGSITSSRDTKKKADIDAIAKTLESQYDAEKGVYPEELLDSFFTAGKKPEKPEGGDYEVSWNSSTDHSGFKVCVILNNGTDQYCRQSSQGKYISAVGNDGTGGDGGSPGSSPGSSPASSPASSPSSCPAAGTCPTTCHTTATAVPNGSCGTTNCPANAPAAQTPPSCRTTGGTVADGNCGTTSYTANCSTSCSGDTCVTEPPKFVFITRSTFGGNLKGTFITIEAYLQPWFDINNPPAWAVKGPFSDGLVGADARCQDDADEAIAGFKIPRQGTYKAWISDGSTSAASRLTHSEGGYTLINGTRVANSWTEMVTQSKLLNPINKTVRNDLVDTSVFTNTKADGSIHSTSEHCWNWTTDWNVNTWIGLSRFSDSWWSLYPGVTSCMGGTYGKRLYCFEQ